MNVDLLDFILTSNIDTPLLSQKRNFLVDDTIGASLLLAANFRKNPQKIVIVTPNLYNAQKIANIISSFIGDDNVLLYPTDDLLRSELLSSSKELLAQRLYVLNETLKGEKKIYITHAAALLTPLPLPVEFKRSIFNIKVGDTLNIDKFKEDLVKSGYYRVNKIDQSLQFASRGDILDIFSVNYSKPIRIEFFDDEVDSIHFFEIENQASTKNVDEVTIVPANDILMSDFEIKEFEENIIKQLQKDRTIIGQDVADMLEQNVSLDIQRIKDRIYSPKTYKYYQYIKHNVSSLFDYVNPDVVFVSNEKQFVTTSNLLISEAQKYFSELFEEGKLPSHLELYRKPEDVFKHEASHLKFANVLRSNDDEAIFQVDPLIVSKANLSTLKYIIESYLKHSEKIVIALANKQQFDTVKNLLNDEKIKYEELDGLKIPNGHIGITLYSLEEGFELPSYKLTFLSSKELFGYHNRSGAFLNKFKQSAILKDYEELEPGDYVVHEYHGIGRYIDMETMEIDGVHRDFLKIEYANNSKLYVPLNQFRLVRKYSGREGAKVKLSSLDGKSWEKTKSKIKERMNELADRLYQLYNERAVTKGFAFYKDDELQEQFNKEFPYELTIDQAKAWEDIKKDMESENVMDRLLCGDVGFGKTEVALRAAFKAISSGKQVAFLCPTTLLARQHYETAVERFRNYGINIAIISRLVPLKKQKDYIEGIKDGTIHLVIGTHRLLSKDFVFKDLGLLIVDEEQRFGVEQKEKIKELKTDVDVLSLSATPIPRTLQLSLIGVRPISQINTPPDNRTTIQTYVAPYRTDVIRELIERELSRNGQVFYIHNTVFNISDTALRIKKQIPSATVGVVHGQMDKDEIEDVMMRFYSGEINVLVATSIIENGIDVPNANLMIVEDADKFGLSQLYQIKGRVGRGDRIAYAYLFYREAKDLSDVALKRLKAIQDFAELGSGYKISQRDLMIRGAGDILGPEQAGFIDSVGLDLYLKMLNEVIEEKKTNTPKEPPKPVKLLKLDAYIPGEYASKEDKLELYQRIENAQTIKELNEVKKQVRDMYGRLPDEVSLLFKKRRIDILLCEEEFKDILEYPTFIEVSLSKKFSDINGVGVPLFDALSPIIDKISITYLQKTLKIKIQKKDNWMQDLETVIDIVISIYKEYKK